MASYSNKDVFTLSSISVILCECFYNLVCIFVDTFLIARILSLTDYNLYHIGLFYLVQYAVIIFTSIFLNYLLKKIKLNYFVTIGALIIIALVMCVYFLDGATLIAYLPLLAVCYAFGSSFFWTGQNNLATIAVSSRYQVRFFTVKKTSVIFIKALVPILLGSSISAMGFQVVAIIMIAFTILLFIFSLFVKPNRKFDMNFKFRPFVKQLFQEKKQLKLLWGTYATAFFYGLSITTLSVLFTYMVYKNMQSDFGLGLVKTVLTGVSLIGMFIFMKSYRKKQAKWYCVVPLIAVPIAGIVMLIWTNIYTVLVFFGLYNILTVNLTSLTDMRRAGVIRMLDMHDKVLEHNAVFEMVLAFARMIGFGLFAIIGLVNTDWLFTVGVALILVLFLGFCITTYNTENQLIEQDKEWKKAHMVYNDKPQT